MSPELQLIFVMSGMLLALCPFVVKEVIDMKRAEKVDRVWTLPRGKE